MFIYTIVNIGSEKSLKEEVALKYPELSFAYSRPGYITFKDNSGKLNIDSKLNLVFARAYGISLGRTNPENLEEEISKYKADVTHRFSLISDEKSGETANLGDTILDVIEVKDGEFWLGMRKVYADSWRVIGANPNLILPEAAPSRAYLKIAEALIWTNYEYRGEESVLELGSAPGGASYAMLERGFKVYGVDNALMDEDLLKNPNFKHIKEPMQKVQDNDVPRPCHLLVSDVNVLPSLILSQLKRFMSIRPGIHTVFYTLKIGDKISVKEVLKHIDTFKTFGFKEVRATQLPSNKSEIMLYGKK
ncbi:SAM-dependent methyltransferase [Cetobacterium sp. ZOR0034]|uniref:SAM-dependent methyltransferase n=1 Tax=Cetobacterium sp. ZOR0034 TaxID=1339239 RepID=UPI0006463966|nr:SAM-dependent methyltransferase [Cetobacterium sp. ZOR0034]